jgi:hypothetical protein
MARRPSLRVRVAVLLVAALACTLQPLAHAGGYSGGWLKARATRYGGSDDWWNINEGSCGYGEPRLQFGRVLCEWAGAPVATAHSRDGSQALRQHQPRAQHRT